MKQAGLPTRLLALLLCLVMVFTTMPMAAFANEASADTALAQPMEEAQQTEEEALAAAEPLAEKDTPEAFSQDSQVMPVADGDTAAEITIKQFAVRTMDSDGYYMHYNSAKQNTSVSDSDYWVYLMPGTTCPTTVPEAEVKTSAWNNCNDYIYTWDNGTYAQIALPNTCTISTAKWEGNVLKFTVDNGAGQTKDFTLTMKDRGLSGTTMAQLKESVTTALKTNMTETFAQLSERVKAIEVPEGIQVKLLSTQNDFAHKAAAGTPEAPEGEAATVNLKVEFCLIDEADNATKDLYQPNGLYYHVLTVVDEPMAYSEADKVTVTAEAYGNGTATAEYVGMVAQAQMDRSYKWVSQYKLTATQGEGQRFITWLYGDSKLTNQTQNPTITATENTTYTACFTENQAPTAKKELSITIQARGYHSQSMYGYFTNQQSVEVDGKTYSKYVTLTYTATLDGKPMNEETLNTAQGEYFNSEMGNFKVWPGNEMIGEHTIVITAHDDLGATAELTIPYTVKPGKISEYKLRLAATKEGEDYPLGEGGLNANITYKAGPNYQYLLENLDNEYYDSTNKYLITIDKWSKIAEANGFYMLKVGTVGIVADNLPTKWTSYQLFGAKDGFRVNYAKTADQLQMYVNVNANMTITEDLTVNLIFDVPATYTPTVTVAESCPGAEITSLKLQKNVEDGSSWKLVTNSGTGWVLDYIQLGEDETTRINSEDGETILWTVTKADQSYTAYFHKLITAEFGDKMNLGGKADYAHRSVAFGEKGSFVFKSYDSLCTSPDYPNETESNTLLYTEQVSFATEFTINEGYPKGATFRGTLYNGEGTTGTVLDNREVTLSTDSTPGTYGVDFVFALPENPGKVTAVLTFGAGSDREYTLTKTFDLTETGITFRAPVESDYAKVVVQVAPAIGPIMVKDFKFYGGLKFLLGAYELEMERNPDAGCKSIVIDTVNGYMNCIVFSTEEPAIAGSVYTEKNFGSGTWGWVTYLVNSYFVDLGIGSWAFYGNELMQWSGLYNTKYGAAFTTPFTAGDPWGIAVLRQYYTDAELVKAGVGDTIRTAEAMAEKYPDHAEEILNRQIVADEVKTIFDPVVEKINAIGEVTKDSAEAIAEARNALDNLPKTFFGSAGYLPALFSMEDPYKTAKKTLETAEETFANLKSPDEKVVILINAIGEVTADSGNDILAARRAYDALTDAEKALVTNYETLTKAETDYTTIQAAQTAKLEALDTIYTATGNTLSSQQPFSFGSTKGEWAVIGLTRAGKSVESSYYDSIVTYVQKHIDEDERLDENKVTDNARLILALTALGKDVTNVGGHDLLKGMNDMDYVENQGLNGPIWALIAINSHDYQIPGGEVTAQKLVNYLLQQQLADGGWALVGDAADTDITGMALQALAPFYGKQEAVTTAVDKALKTLSALQNADGSFSSSDALPTAESTAQIIVALAALKINPHTDSRFVKYGNSAMDALRKFYLTGNFAHDLGGSSNDLATEQSYYALVAYFRLTEQKTSLYDMTDVDIPSQKPTETSVERLAGSNRWETAIQIAEQLKKTQKIEKFQTILVASGNNFVDALAGSYLSTAQNAPILLSWGNGGNYAHLDTENIEYIKANLAENGTVYILGGTAAVPELYEAGLAGLNVRRLNGANRFETNLQILQTAGVPAGSEILVCTSTNYADSLSASATGKPVLLVWNERKSLTDEQKTWLEGLTDCTFTIIGGETAVCAELKEALGAYGEVNRLNGANRFDTSVLVAETYFSAPEALVLTYGNDFPDGLCGALLAHTMHAPLVLCMADYEQAAADYAADNAITSGIVLGGESRLSADSVAKVFPNN